MFQDPTFWVAVAFVIAIVGIFKPVSKIILGGIDGRSERIRQQLDEAQSLREEAQRTLADYKRKQRDAVSDAEKIIENAKAEAVRLREEAERDLKTSLARRAEQAEEKIRQAEANALSEVRAHAVDLAMAATGKLLQDNLDQTRSDALVENSINEVSTKLN